MKQTLGEIKLLLQRLSVAFLAYPICKILFFLFNQSYFTDVGFGEFLKVLFYGLRFDLSALVLMNAPFIILHMIPFFQSQKWYQWVLKTLFLLLNSISILADCFDLAYYRYTLKRTTLDFFDLFGLGSDIPALLPQYIKDFWYVILMWLLLTWFIVWLYNKTGTPRKETESLRNIRYAAGRVGSWLVLNSLIIGLSIIAFRGGLQLRPIMPINASEYVSAKNIPLVVSTPFSIIKSYGLEVLEEKKYFSEEELKKIYTPIHQGVSNSGPVKRTNVFIIILESFSKEYVGSLSGRPTHTPFLDSLIKESLVFDNAFANGKKSIEGIPAVLGGLPSLTNEPYIVSSYGSNKFTGISNALKTLGYSTAFFHGGTKGTMGFDAYCSAAGFDKYYGRTEYNDDKHFDGDWGIWDEDFFQFTEKTVSGMPQPFCAALFSLSSHHPCAIPEKYKERFPEGEMPILKSVEYTDYSLQKFFEAASKEKWFDSTLFVITADHTGPSNDAFFSNSTGIFEIPIVFYQHNSNLQGISHRVSQQIDILPSILDHLNYNNTYFAFGNTMLDSSDTGCAVNFTNDVYQLFEDDHLLQFDGHNSIGFYNFKTDSLLQTDLKGKMPEKELRMENKLKAIIQTYYHGMIHNKLTAQ